MNSSSRPVLYLSYDGLSDAIGQSQVLPYLRACRAKGIPFHLVTFEKAGNAEKVAQIDAMLRAEGFVWHRLTFTEKSGMAHKVYDFGRFIGKAFSVSRKHRCAVVHSRSYFASMVGMLLKMVGGKKLIFDKRDFWIDAIVETGRLDLRKGSHKLAHRFLRAFERRLFTQSDHIISLTYAAREVVLQRYPEQKPDTVSVIPCCADLALFDRQKVNATDVAALKKQYGLEGEGPVFGYVGSVGPAYMIPELFDCFNVIRQKLPGAKLLFLVNNSPEEIFRMAEAKGIDRSCMAVTRAPREKMPLHIALIDYGFFFVMPSFGKKATSPTKQYEMLAMGKSVVTNKGVGDAEKVFSELKCGFLTSDFNQENYEVAADWVLAHPPQNGYYDLSHYSLAYGAEKYHHVYRLLLDGKN